MGHIIKRMARLSQLMPSTHSCSAAQDNMAVALFMPGRHRGHPMQYVLRSQCHRPQQLELSKPVKRTHEQLTSVWPVAGVWPQQVTDTSPCHRANQ